MTQKLITLGGGFLLAVLWFDLMFDVQVWPHWGAETLPEDALVSIATYYARVTTAAAPMNLLVGGVMFLTIGAVIHNLFRGEHRLWVRVGTLVLVSVPVIAAQLVIFPGAKQLATRADTLAVQTALANAIFTAHVVCFAAIALMLALQFLPTRKTWQAYAPLDAEMRLLLRRAR
ncbi:MAG: hypothetical protein RLN89_10590 [Parvibaculum sp.]